MLREKPGEPEYVELDTAKTPFYSNLAQCQLKLGDYYDCVDSCTQAIERAPAPARCSKAYYCRARAHIHVWNMEEARADLHALAAAAPDMQRLVNDELARIRQLEASKQKQEKDVCKAMFVK
jgi:AH receptor-interacting protein